MKQTTVKSAKKLSGVKGTTTSTDLSRDSLKSLINDLTKTINELYGKEATKEIEKKRTSSTTTDKNFYAQTNQILIQDIRRPRRK